MDKRHAPTRRHGSIATPPALLVGADTRRVDVIEQSHERCLALGLDEAVVPEVSVESSSRLTEARERHRRLFEQAAPVMEMLFEQIVFTRSIVALTDPQGSILHSIGDPGFLEKAQQIALAPGVNWSESTKGTNAIGTALFTEAATLVHGDEHYVRANRFLTCSACPIFDHAGQVLGLLDVTGDHRSYHPHTLAMVGMSARMIENQWFTDKFRHGMRLHFHNRPEMLGTLREAMLALSPDGRVLGANRSALDLLGMNIAALRMQGLEAVFGIGVDAIVDHCRRNADEPMRLYRARGGEAVLARGFFNWPTLWPVLATAAASPSEPPAAAHAPPSQTAALDTSAFALPARPTPTPPPGTTAPTLQMQEIEAIRLAVEAADGNISRAARQLGIARNTVYRKLRAAATPAAL